MTGDVKNYPRCELCGGALNHGHHGTTDPGECSYRRPSRPSLFQVGSRIAFNVGLSHDPRWECGEVVDVRHGDGLYSYRIRWDDGFQDFDTTAWYGEAELRPANEVGE